MSLGGHEEPNLKFFNVRNRSLPFLGWQNLDRFRKCLAPHFTVPTYALSRIKRGGQIKLSELELHWTWNEGLPFF